MDRYLASGDEKGNVRIWDVEFEETVLVIGRPEGVEQMGIIGIEQIWRGKHVGGEDDSGGGGGGIEFGEILVQYRNGMVFSVDVRRDSCGREIRGWKFGRRGGDGGKLLRLGEGFCRMKFIGSEMLGGAGETGSEIVVRDMRSGETCGELSGVGGGMLMGVCDGGEGRVVGSFEDGRVLVWDLRGGVGNKVLGSVQVTREKGSGLTDVTGGPRGRVVITGGVEGVAGIGDVRYAHDLRVLRRVGCGNGVGQVAWRRDGKVVASAGWDGVVRTWSGRRCSGDSGLLKPVGALAWHQGSVRCLHFGANGALVSGGQDSCIVLWTT